jgi:hypothetical protein
LLHCVIAVSVIACARSAEHTPDSQASVLAAPTISEATPARLVMTGAAPLTLDIVGTGFEDSTNTIVLGPVSATNVRGQSNGTRIVFTVPDRVPSGGGAAPVLWTSGRYPLTVTTTRGTSNVVTIDVEEKR